MASNGLRGSLRRPLLLVLLLCFVAVYVALKDARKEKLRKDFSTYSLAASRVMFAGGDPYDKQQVGNNYKYFPANAILIHPFTWINVYAAQGIWFALNLGLVIWAFIALRDMLRPAKLPWWVFIITLAISFRLIIMNLRLGQWNTSVFCLSIIGLRHLNARHWWGAPVLALAVTLKFMPSIFLVYLASRRRWKDLFQTVLAVIFWIFVLPIIVLGPARTVTLLHRYQQASAERVEEMTAGAEVSSVSLHSTIYRALSPVTLEVKDTVYRANLLNLPNEKGAAIARAISMLLLGIGIIWLFMQGRRGNPVNHLGEITVIGLCYLFWFLTAPGVRHGQLLSTIPLTFAVVSGIAMAGDVRTRRTLQAGVLAIFILYTIPSEIVKGTTYNHWLHASGVLAWAMMLHTIVGLFVYYKLGRENERLMPATARGQFGTETEASTVG